MTYGQNPDKTRDGELVATYMCDPKTVDAEFLLSKAQYKAITGREQKRDVDVLYYQMRQSFALGEAYAETAWCWLTGVAWQLNSEFPANSSIGMPHNFCHNGKSSVSFTVSKGDCAVLP